MNGFFKWALDYVLQNEGGFIDDPVDAGGATNMGVSLASYRKLVDPKATVGTIRDLSVDEAASFYSLYYWIPLKLDAAKQPGPATAILDAAVLFGPGEIAKLVQEALVDCGMNLEVDGAIGPETLDALNGVRLIPFLTNFVGRLKWLIGRIVANRPADEKYRAGWVSRIERYTTLA